MTCWYLITCVITQEDVKFRASDEGPLPYYAVLNGRHLVACWIPPFPGQEMSPVHAGFLRTQLETFLITFQTPGGMSQGFYQSELLQPYTGAGAQANKPISFGGYESRLRNIADALLFIYLFTYTNLEQPLLLAF